MNARAVKVGAQRREGGRSARRVGAGAGRLVGRFWIPLRRSMRTLGLAEMAMVSGAPREGGSRAVVGVGEGALEGRSVFARAGSHEIAYRLLWRVAVERIVVVEEERHSEVVATVVAATAAVERVAPRFAATFCNELLRLRK